MSYREMARNRSQSRSKPKKHYPGGMVTETYNRRYNNNHNKRPETSVPGPVPIHSSCTEKSREVYYIPNHHHHHHHGKPEDPHRPKTGLDYSTYYLSGIVNRLGFGSASIRPEQLNVNTSSDLYKRKHEILGNGINLCCPEWSLYHSSVTNNTDENSEHPRMFQQPTKEEPKHCDLEFVNKKFRYIEENASVNELTQELQGDLRTPDDQADGDGDDSSKPGALSNFMSSVLSTISMRNVSHKLFGQQGISGSDLISSAARMGERIYRAGVGVAQSFFSDQDIVRDDRITYNGYTIHTLGNNLCINSIILRGPKNNKLRLILQTKEFRGLRTDTEGDTKVTTRSIREPKVFLNDDKWTMVYGSYEEEGTGMVEIEVPSGLSAGDIQIGGPSKGLLFIDVP